MHLKRRGECLGRHAQQPACHRCRLPQRPHIVEPGRAAWSKKAQRTEEEKRVQVSTFSTQKMMQLPGKYSTPGVDENNKLYYKKIIIIST